ncbi:21837_t:CDS:2, partial [Gigaspora margarita]
DNLFTLKRALPPNYNYVIDSFEAIQPLNFLGAFSEPFKVKFHVNICTVDNANIWLDEFSNLHKVNMRETQGQKGENDPTNVNTTGKEKSEIISTRKRDTKCPAILSIQLRNILDTYPCIISLTFHHNHPLVSSHSLSFRPICNETKEVFFKLFHNGHGPASAYHTYIEEIQLKYENNEEVLADRAICPNKHDVYYLHKKFLNQSIGARNGKEMFNRLTKEIEEFNANEKGYAWMQPYIAPTNADPGQPFILVIVTNLMKRCHSLQQAGELIYMDTTAGLDDLNTSLTVLSTNTSIGSLPLATILTSDETTSTFSEALNRLKRILPITAFNNRGPIIGPEVIMTDNCKAERIALHNTWNKATLLLCVFHFLQAMWRWLRDGKNGVNMDDRVIIIEHLKRMEWAIAFRQWLPIRNNHTNNFAENGIRIIKDIIFGRIQAFNVIQIFHFIVNTMDLYYIRKLLSVAHNRPNNFIALRFRLSGWKLGSKDDIKILNFESLTFKHRSSTNSDKWYLVDMQVGMCECSPIGVSCKHQASISFHYHICSLNQTPVLSVNSRYNYAYLALGEKRKELSFYADLHQEKINQDELLYSAEFATLNNNNSVDNAINEDRKNNFQNFDDKENILPESLAFVSVQFLINEVISEAESVYDNNSSDEESRGNDSTDSNTSNNEDEEGLHQLTIDEFRWFYNDLESLLEKNDSTFDKSIQKFVNAYKKRHLVQDTHIYPAIASFFQTCDWNEKRVNGKSYQ